MAVTETHSYRSTVSSDAHDERQSAGPVHTPKKAQGAKVGPVKISGRIIIAAASLTRPRQCGAVPPAQPDSVLSKWQRGDSHPEL